MKQNITGVIGLLAIPLAALGIVGSVAFAQSGVPVAPTPVAQHMVITTDAVDTPELGDVADSPNEQVGESDKQDTAGDTETQDDATGNDGETNDDGAATGK